MESGHKRDALCAALEQEYVHDVYNKTAHHFTDVRYKAWPRVRDFLLELPAGSMVGDIGCGSGKYLAINRNILTLGCDRSTNLLEVAGQQNRQVLSCDNLRLPFRDGCFDALISIGVIHHFTTPSRRAAAIQEVSRVLRPGGRVMIYVWAMEQKHRKFKAQDLLVPWHLKTKHRKGAKLRMESRKEKLQRHDDLPPSPTKPISPPPPSASAAISKSQYTYKGNIDHSARPMLRSHMKKDSVMRNSFVRSNTSGSEDSDMRDNPHAAVNSSSDFRYMLKNHFRIQKKKATSPVISGASFESFKISPDQDLVVKPEVVADKEVTQVSVTNEKTGFDVKSKESKTFPATVKSKFLNFIGIGAKPSSGNDDSFLNRRPSTQSEKDLKYKQLLEEIVKEDSKLFASSTGDGDIVPSVLAMEGFAVREFPGSSCRTPLTEDPVRDSVENLKANNVVGNGSQKCQNGKNQSSKVVFHLGDLKGGTVPQCDFDADTEAESCYKQKCANWLEHGKLYKVNRPDTLKLPKTNGIVKKSRKDSDSFGSSPESPARHMNGFQADDEEEDVPHENEDWVKVTTKLINTIQAQVNQPTGQGQRISKDDEVTHDDVNGLNGLNEGQQCKCKVKPTLISNSENFKSDEANVLRSNGRQRIRSESSLSSFSSVSSDSDSILSDIEEMSVCAVCRGDSTECHVPAEGSPPLGFDKAGALESGEPPHLSARISSDPDLLRSSASVRGASDPRPMQIKTQTPALRSSHDSGYSETDLLSAQDHATSLDKFAVSPGSQRRSQSSAELRSKDDVEKSLNPDAGTDQQVQEENDSYKRFYHVFREGELNSLIEKRVKSLRVSDSFYDHANWCVIAEKIV